MPIILFVEDHAGFSKALRKQLLLGGYQVEQAWNGEQALQLIQERQYDVALIDWTLPGAISGLEVCRKLRAVSETVGISFLTGRDSEQDKVVGLRSGADDYMVKMPDLGEFQARLESLCRRSSRPPSSSRLCQGPIEVDLVNDQVFVSGAPVELTRLEYKVLVCLLRNIGRRVSRKELEEAAFGAEMHKDPSAIRQIVYRLRKRLGEAGNLIQWRPSDGYGVILDDV